MEVRRAFSESLQKKAVAPGRAWMDEAIFLKTWRSFSKLDISCSRVAELGPSAYLTTMANGPMPRAGLCALLLVCAGCSSDHDPAERAAGGSPGAAGGVTQANAGASHAGAMNSGAGAANAGGSADTPSGGEGSGAPPAVDGRSIYALECHGDSKDCSLATVPCFGVSSQTPNVAAGWACANRCVSSADCSDAPAGAEAQARCVPFSSTSHCVLVCQNENQSFTCPDGMTCYTPPKSPIGYCLWQ
jgi:hypothetical protein